MTSQNDNMKPELEHANKHTNKQGNDGFILLGSEDKILLTETLKHIRILI